MKTRYARRIRKGVTLGNELLDYLSDNELTLMVRNSSHINRLKGDPLAQTAYGRVVNRGLKRYIVHGRNNVERNSRADKVMSLYEVLTY